MSFFSFRISEENTDCLPLSVDKTVHLLAQFCFLSEKWFPFNPTVFGKCFLVPNHSWASFYNFLLTVVICSSSLPPKGTPAACTSPQRQWDPQGSSWTSLGHWPKESTSWRILVPVPVPRDQWFSPPEERERRPQWQMKRNRDTWIMSFPDGWEVKPGGASLSSNPTLPWDSLRPIQLCHVTSFI